MKKRNLWLGVCLSIVFGGMAASCSKDDDEPGHDDSGSKIELPNDRVFILNSGSIGANNASISLYDWKTGEVIDDIFYRQNGMRLGDTGQDMIEDDDEIYVSVFGSNYLAKLNAAGVEMKRVSFTGDPELQGGVKSLAEEDDYIYASFHGGVVAKIRKSDLTIERKLTNIGVALGGGSVGANLEGMAIVDHKLYVANSYSQTVDPETGQNIFVYHDDLFVIDLRSFSVTESVTVGVNPNRVEAIDDRLFVLCYGNYADKGYDFQMVEPRRGNKVTSIAAATDFAGEGTGIYLVNSVTDWTTYTTTNSFFFYDLVNMQLVETSFMKGAPEALNSASISMMSVDRKTGELYIGTSDYITNGEVYKFGRGGQYFTKFESGGITPFKAVYLHL